MEVTYLYGLMEVAESHTNVKLYRELLTNMEFALTI